MKDYDYEPLKCGFCKKETYEYFEVMYPGNYYCYNCASKIAKELEEMAIERLKNKDEVLK